MGESVAATYKGGKEIRDGGERHSAKGGMVNLFGPNSNLGRRAMNEPGKPGFLHRNGDQQVPKRPAMSKLSFDKR
jgi:hypothetical protein